MEIIRKSNRIIFKDIETVGKIVIPSNLYPLESDKFELFDHTNTTSIVDKTIIDVFNSITPEIGRCYTNSENLCNKLISYGYAAKQYVGWLFVGDKIPIHHSFVILNNHILDISVNLKQKDIDILEKYQGPLDEQRRHMVDYMNSREFLPNNEKCNFGKCDILYTYVATEATKEQGIFRQRKLREIYPDHPAFRDIRSSGKTKMQEML